MPELEPSSAPKAATGWKRGGSLLGESVPGAAVALQMLHWAGGSSFHTGRSCQASQRPVSAVKCNCPQCKHERAAQPIDRCHVLAAPLPTPTGHMPVGDRLSPLCRARPNPLRHHPRRAPARSAAEGQPGRAGGGGRRGGGRAPRPSAMTRPHSCLKSGGAPRGPSDRQRRRCCPPRASSFKAPRTRYFISLLYRWLL